jgi:hypothetical protein
VGRKTLPRDVIEGKPYLVLYEDTSLEDAPSHEDTSWLVHEYQRLTELAVQWISIDVDTVLSVLPGPSGYRWLVDDETKNSGRYTYLHRKIKRTHQKINARLARGKTPYG